MSYSLNEIEAMGKKATRGAGYSWGLAEEGAKALRWLSSHDLPGAQALCNLLAQATSAVPEAVPPVITGNSWQAQDAPLCPLQTGAALCDMAPLLDLSTDTAGVALAPVTQPLLVVPFVATIARRNDYALSLIWDGCQVVFTPQDVHVDMTAPDALLPDIPVQMTFRRHDGPAPDTATPRAMRGRIAPDLWAMLGSYAHRTYAPATEASRLMGAGAGLSDND